MPFYTIKWVQNICSHVDLRRTEFPLWWCARFAKIAGKVLRGSQFLRLAYFASQCFIFIGKPFLQSQGNTFENWHFHDSMKTVVNVCCHQHLFAGGFYKFLNLWVAYSRNVFYSHPLFSVWWGAADAASFACWWLFRIPISCQAFTCKWHDNPATTKGTKISESTSTNA